MKILYDNHIFITQNYGGVPRYFFELMNYWHNTQGLEYKFPVVYSENEYLKNTEIASWVKMFRKSGLLKIGEVRKNLRRLNQFLVKKELKAGNFDIFHPTYYEDYYLDWIKDKKLVITIHDMIHETYPEHFKTDIYNTKEYKKLLAYRADKIIAVSENTKTDILRFYPDINPEKIEVVYHGNPLDKFDFSQKSGFQCPEKYILYVGNRNLYKNFDFFIKSIASLLKEDKTLKLFAVGSADITQEEMQLFIDLGIKNSVVYHRASDVELVDIYKNALCFVFPSLFEGFGIPVLEAFGCECPVILSNRTSLPEVGGEACEYFNPECPESILNAVKKVVYDEKLRADMIKKGSERLKDFNWQKTAEQTKKVYESIL